MSVEFSFTIQGDSEGYVTFLCPFCGSEFKLRADEYQNDDKPFEDLFCPYCGLTRVKIISTQGSYRKGGNHCVQLYG